MWQERVEKFWREHEDVRLSLDVVKRICPACAEKMEKSSLKEIKISPKQMPEHLLQGLCDKIGEDEGFWTRCMETSFGDFEPDEKEAFCAWLHHECLGKWPAEKQPERGERMAELTGPIVLKDEPKRIVYGPVLVPDEPDTDGDVVTAEQIERVAHKFIEDYGNIDLQHSLNNVGRVVESYITPVDLKFDAGDEVVTVPKGSWMMGVRVTDDDVWEKVVKGELTGFSIMGIAKAILKAKYQDNLEHAVKESAIKRTTLADLGDDWVVNAVSLVDEPAVPKAKWLIIKSKDKNQGEGLKESPKNDGDHRSLDQGINREEESGEEVADTSDIAKESVWEKVKKSLGFSTKEGRVISKENLEILRGIRSTIAQELEKIDTLLERAGETPGDVGKSEGGELKMDEQKVEKMISDAVAPVQEQLDELVKALKNDALIRDDQDDQGDQGDQGDHEEDEKAKNEDESLEEQFLKAIEKVKTMSKRIAGQDDDSGHVTKTWKRDRDPFGFKRKTD